MTDTTPRAHTDAAPDHVTFTLDGQQVQANPGELIIAAAERAGVYIPRFCYHPRMRSVGMCRMCLVEVKGPRGFTLAPACFQAVAEGMEVRTGTETVRKAQDGVLEFLLVNHPLDCPVCDKGGECPLQDQTLAYGPGESRFLEEKRHWAKPIPVSSLVTLDRERCIQCDRCTRFAAEVAGDAFITFQGRGDHIEVNTFPDRPFASYFSGNTVQICPVGALTATPYRFKARPWDLEQVESTCVSCGLGCRVALQSSAGQIVRSLGIDVDAVNQGWLCDKGRFGTGALDSPGRRTTPLVRSGDELLPASWASALKRVADHCGNASPGETRRIAVIGGARLANEDAYAWAKLAKGVLGTDSVDAQLGDGLPAELIQALPRATIAEACAASTVIVIGPDVRETLPVLFLRLRAAAQAKKTRIIELSPTSSSLSAHAYASLRYLPGEMAALAGTLLAPASPPAHRDGGNQMEPARREMALAAQRGGSDVVVLVGRPSLASASDDVVECVSMLAKALPEARFLPLGRRGNVQGALDAGLAPGILPGRVDLGSGREHYAAVWPTVPQERGMDTAAILAAAARGEIDVLFLLGADPLSDFPDRSVALAGLEGAGLVVSVETLPNASSAHAGIVLPAAGYGERPGTTTNCEGRVTTLGQKVSPKGVAWPDWMIAAELADALGADLGFDSLEDIWGEMGALSPLHAGLRAGVIERFLGGDGVVLPMAHTAVGVPRSPSRAPALDPMAVPGIGSVETQGSPSMAGAAVAAWEEAVTPKAVPSGSGRPPMLTWRAPAAPGRTPLRDGYALRLVSSHPLYAMGTAVTASRHLAPLAPASALHVNPSDLDSLGLKSGDDVIVVSPKGRVKMSGVADPAVARGVAYVPYNGTGVPVNEILDVSRPVTDIRLETP